jgi:hypothetical protein
MSDIMYDGEFLGGLLRIAAKGIHEFEFKFTGEELEFWGEIQVTDKSLTYEEIVDLCYSNIAEQYGELLMKYRERHELPLH